MFILPKRMISLIMILLFCFTVQAKDAEVNNIILGIEKKQSNPELKKQAIIKGKERAVLCNQCHGEDGNSTKSSIPNLAAQNPVYLLNQIEMFSDGRRKNFVMNALSKNFSRDDKENLAIFYSSMKVKVAKTNVQLAKMGQPIYAKQCSTCHGETGIGQANFARLAGQKTGYVETTLKRFRENSKDGNKSSNRNNPIMETMAKNLSDNDIKALASYISQLE